MIITIYKPNEVSPHLVSVDADCVILEARVSGKTCVAAQFYVQDDDSERWDKWEPIGDKISLFNKYNGDYVRIAVVPEGEISDDYDVDAVVSNKTYFENGHSYKWRVDMWEQEVQEGLVRSGGISYVGELEEPDGDSPTPIPTRHAGWVSNELHDALRFRMLKGDKTPTNDLQEFFLNPAGNDNYEAFINGAIAEGAYVKLPGGNGGEDVYLKINHIGYYINLPMTDSYDLSIPRAANWTEGEYYTAFIELESVTPPDYNISNISNSSFEIEIRKRRTYSNDYYCRYIIPLYTTGSGIPPIYVTYGAAIRSDDENPRIVRLQYSNLIKDNMYVNFPEFDGLSEKYYPFTVIAANVQDAYMDVEIPEGVSIPWSDDGSSITYKIYSAFISSDEYYFTCEQAQALQIYANGEEILSDGSTSVSLVSPVCNISGVLGNSTEYYPIQSRLQVMDVNGNLIYDSGKVFKSVISYDLNIFLGGETYVAKLWVEDNIGRTYEVEASFLIESWGNTSNTVSISYIDNEGGVFISPSFGSGIIPGGEAPIFSIYRRRGHERRLCYLGDVPDGESLIDYCVGNREEVCYYVFSTAYVTVSIKEGDIEITETIQTTALSMLSDYICPEWDSYFVIGLSETDDDDERFKVNSIWNFYLNAQEGTVTHNYGFEVYTPLAKYPKIGRDENDYLTGSLTVGLGYIECDDYYDDTVDLQKDWREFCAKSDRVIYKDLKGNVYIIRLRLFPTLQ